jgi:hypothetical protein
LAKELRVACEKHEVLKRFIGMKAFSYVALCVWMNACALPKTQEVFERIFGGEEKASEFRSAREAATRAENADPKNLRKMLYDRVDASVSGTFKSMASEISQSQLFSAIESAIFTVFGSANLGCVPSEEKNTLAFLWWHALVMLGILCYKYDYEIVKHDDGQSFVSLRKKKKKGGTKSKTNVIDWSSEEKKLLQYVGLPIPTEKEFVKYYQEVSKSSSLTLKMKEQPQQQKVVVERRKRKKKTAAVTIVTCVLCEQKIETGQIHRVPKDCPNENLRGGPCHKSCRTKLIGATCVLCEQKIEKRQIYRVPKDCPNENLRGGPCHQSCRTKLIGAT